MLLLSRHAGCPLWKGYEAAEVPWKGLQFACLNVLRLYCKIFDKQDVFMMLLRKTCQSCKCPREAHETYQKEWGELVARFGLLAPGLLAEKAETSVEWTGSGSEVELERLARQVPRQDLAAEQCRHLQPHQRPSYEDFIVARNEIALDIGYPKERQGSPAVCPTCRLAIQPGDSGVVATRLGDDVMFHPSCFTCTTCGDLLADLAYCALGDRPYCERHYAEMLKPRCAACDERDDGTGRRRSFKKRHSSSSNSSRDSKASREEELRIFTSLEESEFENQKSVRPDCTSAPSLSARSGAEDARGKSPQHSLSPEGAEERRDSRSLSIERRRLRDMPQVSPFKELPTEERAQEEDFALSKLKSDDAENDTEDADDDDDAVTY